MQLDVPHGKPNQELLDQQTIVEDYDLRRQRLLLIGEVGVVKGRQTGRVAVLKHPSQLPPGDVDAPGDHQGGITKIDERDFATVVDPPAMAEIGRKAGLASMGHLDVRGCGHSCIVTRSKAQGIAGVVELTYAISRSGRATE